MGNKTTELRCKFCGLLFVGKTHNAKYCSEDCRKAAKSVRNSKLNKSTTPKKHIQAIADKSIGAVMRELDEYNRIHKKALSYGQYVALREGK